MFLGIIRPGLTRRVGPIAIAIPVLLVALAGCGGTDLVGADLGKTAAPGFTLTDYRGDHVSLSDFRGKVVVLTFIYTNCPDVCPLTAENLRLAYERLSAKNQSRVALVAITVDPERDSSAALKQFSVTHRLDANPHWFALRGERAELAPVWQSYGVDPGQVVPHRDQSLVDAAGSPDTSDLLAHTDAIFVIDRQGRERVLMRSNLAPADLAKNIEALAS
jgi:protein SCO1/2